MSKNKQTEILHVLRDRYDYLIYRDNCLSAMEAAGVDNWQGWDEVEWPEDPNDKEEENEV